jgi:hypothetical protein
MQNKTEATAHFPAVHFEEYIQAMACLKAVQLKETVL